jgi:hypothetical protein
MMGPSHRLAGAVCWLAAAPLLAQAAVWQLVLGAAVAAAFAHGRLSPDIDRKWKYHRGVTHFWLWPVLLYAAGRWFEHAQPGSPVIATVIYAVAIGWASHVSTDAIFGLVPLLPRIIPHGRSSFRSPHWQYAGLGFQTGGLVEKVIAVPVFFGAGLWLIVGMM